MSRGYGPNIISIVRLSISAMSQTSTSRQSIVSGGRTFRPSGGRLIPEAQFKAIQRQEAIQRKETIQRQEAIKKQQLQERVRRKTIIEKRRGFPKISRETKFRYHFSLFRLLKSIGLLLSTGYC